MYFHLTKGHDNKSILRQGRLWWRPFWKEYINNENKEALHKGVGVHFEWIFFTHFWHMYLHLDNNNDDQIMFSFACGLFAFWLGFENLSENIF